MQPGLVAGLIFKKLGATTCKPGITSLIFGDEEIFLVTEYNWGG
jgi:hypothetical protein